MKYEIYVEVYIFACGFPAAPAPLCFYRLYLQRLVDRGIELKLLQLPKTGMLKVTKMLRNFKVKLSYEMGCDAYSASSQGDFINMMVTGAQPQLSFMVS